MTKEQEKPKHIDEFKALIQEKIGSMNGSYIDLTSGDIHRELGGYPSSNHRMPICCEAMTDLMREPDEIISQPQKGLGATLTIRYYRR